MDDGLKHRPRSEWSIMYMNCEFSDAEIWLKSALLGDLEVKQLCITKYHVTSFSVN